MNNKTLWRDLPMFICFMSAIAIMDGLKDYLTPKLGPWGARGVAYPVGMVLIVVAALTVHRLFYGRDKA
jgi:hypothetical protein